MNFQTRSHSVKINPMAKKLFSVFFILGLLIFKNSPAQDIPAKPDPPRLVNDFANILTQQERITLEKKLVAFDDSTSTQIVIVTVKDIGGYDKAEYATAIGEKWGVGHKGKNNTIKNN